MSYINKTTLKNNLPISQKQHKNNEYLTMLDRSMAQIENGDVITKTMEELEAME